MLYIFIYFFLIFGIHDTAIFACRDNIRDEALSSFIKNNTKEQVCTPIYQQHSSLVVCQYQKAFEKYNRVLSSSQEAFEELFLEKKPSKEEKLKALQRFNKDMTSIFDMYEIDYQRKPALKNCSSFIHALLFPLEHKIDQERFLYDSRIEFLQNKIQYIKIVQNRYSVDKEDQSKIFDDMITSLHTIDLNESPSPTNFINNEISCHRIHVNNSNKPDLYFDKEKKKPILYNNYMMKKSKKNKIIPSYNNLDSLKEAQDGYKDRLKKEAEARHFLSLYQRQLQKNILKKRGSDQSISEYEEDSCSE